MKHVLYGGVSGVPLRLIWDTQRLREALQDSVQAAVEQERAATEAAVARIIADALAVGARHPSAKRVRP